MFFFFFQRSSQIFANGRSWGEISISCQAPQGDTLSCAHSSQAWLFLPCLLQPVPDQRWLLPHCPVLTPLLTSVLLLLSVCRSLCPSFTSRPFPGSPGQSSRCSETLVQPVSLISVSPCGLWLRAPCIPSLALVSLLGDLLRTHSSYPPCSSEYLLQSLLARQYPFDASTSDPQLSQHRRFLVPLVTLQVHISSGLHPQSLLLP